MFALLNIPYLKYYDVKLTIMKYYDIKLIHLMVYDKGKKDGGKQRYLHTNILIIIMRKYSYQLYSLLL